MANLCATCNHPNRIEIDRALIQGKAVSVLSRKHGVSANSLHYHKENHLTRQLVTAMEKKQLTEDFNLLERIDDILNKAKDIFDRNYAKKRDGIALKALKEQRSTIELLAKISFALHEVKKLEGEHLSQQQVEEQEQEYMESLKILTFEELVIYQKLTEKIESQDKTIVIKADKEPKRKKLETKPMGSNLESEPTQLESNKPTKLKRTKFVKRTISMDSNI